MLPAGRTSSKTTPQVEPVVQQACMCTGSTGPGASMKEASNTATAEHWGRPPRAQQKEMPAFAPPHHIPLADPQACTGPQAGQVVQLLDITLLFQATLQRPLYTTLKRKEPERQNKRAAAVS